MKTTAEQYPSFRDILPEGMSAAGLLSRLRKRVTEVNGGRHPLERGSWIRENFPSEAFETLRLADEAMKGMLVLPGTGPDLYYVGNPPKWTVNPSGDPEYLYQLNRMHHWKTMCEAYSLTGDLQYAEKVIQELDGWIDANPCPPLNGQIEGCPSYHNGCVFWFSMRNVFSGKFGLPVPQPYTERLRAMFIHSVHATRACGGNFPWGDSHTADKETLCLAAVSCYMAFGDRMYLAAAAHFYPAASLLSDIRDNLWRIPGLEQLKEDLLWAQEHPQLPELPLLAWQKDLNQVYYRSSWDKQALSLMTACRTPVQNAHAHMDPGGFDFTAFGFPLISDPGIYTYKDGEDRYRFKRAASHNCLTVNGADPWKYLASWDYGPQRDGCICAVEQSGDTVCITSRHENYAPAAAVRHLAVIENRFLIITDHITGLSADDTVEIHYHLNRTDIACRPPQSLFSLDSGPSVELTAGTVPEALRVEDGYISDSNDVRHSSKIVTFYTKPDKRGECWFSVLAIAHPLSPGRQTGRLKHTVPTHGKDSLLLDCQTESRAFRLILRGNTLVMENGKYQRKQDT